MHCVRIVTISGSYTIKKLLKAFFLNFFFSFNINNESCEIYNSFSRSIRLYKFVVKAIKVLRNQSVKSFELYKINAMPSPCLQE